MDEDTLQRQVALVSYGNKFLRREVTLDAIFRHGVFYGKRLLFRALDNNALLADDFTLWLEILRELGVQRLSLHRAAQFALHAGQARDGGGGLAIVAHYPDHCQLWVCGEEDAAWWHHSALPKGGYQRASMVPSAAYYGGDIDSFWYVQEIRGEIAVPEIDWQAIAAAIAEELQLTVKDAKAAPFHAHMRAAPDWANFPLFPYADQNPLPHQLLKVLTDAQAAFANDSHCKNENGYFQHMSHAEAAEKVRWSERLNQWTIDLQLHCANDDQPHATIQSDLAPEHQSTPSQLIQEDKLSGDASPRQPDSNWIKACAFAVLLGLLSLLLLGVCHLIANHAWLALVLGLPFAIYVWSPSTKK